MEKQLQSTDTYRQLAATQVIAERLIQDGFKEIGEDLARSVIKDLRELARKHDDA